MSHVHAGHVTDDRRIAGLPSLAIILVVSALQDVPNTVPESMICGTPVVSLDNGGVPNMVRPGKTGWLAVTDDVQSLRKAIELAFEDGGGENGCDGGAGRLWKKNIHWNDRRGSTRHCTSPL